MSDAVHREWFIRRWQLPPEAWPAVAGLLEAERNGSTAAELTGAPPDWGAAALPAEVPGSSPLVWVTQDGRTYLQARGRHDLECAVAQRLLALAAEPADPVVDERVRTLFPGSGPDDRQAQAAAVSVTRKLAIITGGPGTGKTHTLARILALLVERGAQPARIRLAAPTGKAADRMRGAVTASLGSLPEDFRASGEMIQRVAQTSATLHALLGYNPAEGRCRFHAGNPLPCEVLIVDECSMIDLTLWAALVAALPAGARLILLGDPNQLESVGQGNVFGELARVAGDPLSPLHAVRVHLTQTHRFRDRPAIAALAQALETRDSGRAEATLEGARDADAPEGVAWIPLAPGALSFAAFPAPVREALATIAQADSPGRALESMNALSVLSAHRGDFVGAAALNATIRAAFPGARNEPVIIDHNDPETGLRNGNVGVIHVGDDGRRRAWFRVTDGTLREWPLAELPGYSPGWAITIHRSQGSEYEDVLVVLPHEESPLATRELLYTAITRARRRVFIVGELATVRRAAMTPSHRVTLLARHLDGTPRT